MFNRAKLPKTTGERIVSLVVRLPSSVHSELRQASELATKLSNKYISANALIVEALKRYLELNKK
jgi:hypothetical protein